MLLRRKTSVTGVPYTFLVLAYGNQMFQVSLPSPKQDSAIYGRDMEIRPVPTLYKDNPLYGNACIEPLDVYERKAPIVLGFDQIEDQELVLLRKYSEKIL